MDPYVIRREPDFFFLSQIAGIVNTGFFLDGGRIRGVPVSISGISYVPLLPYEADVKDKIRKITEGTDTAIDRAVKLCLFCLRSQIFLDGNKRTSFLFANHYLIARGGGYLMVPEKLVPGFQKLLERYYEDEVISSISSFIKQHRWKSV